MDHLQLQLCKTLPEGRGRQVALTVRCFLTVLTVALVIIQRQQGKIESNHKSHEEWKIFCGRETVNGTTALS